MSKWIKCLVTASKVVMVECEDDDVDPGATASNIAGNEAFDGVFDEITDHEVAAQNVDSEKRHADKIIRLEQS